MPKRDSVLAKLGLNVRKRREARELTQEKLAERAGLDSTYIMRMLQVPELQAAMGMPVKMKLEGASAALAKLLEMKENDPEKYWEQMVKFHDGYCWQ
jgi:transcriptional regulator with XRE-family HTH domain